MPVVLICGAPRPFAPFSEHRSFLQSLDGMKDCAQVQELREQTLAYIRKGEANPKRRAGHLLGATKYRRFLGYDCGDGSLSNDGWCTTSSGITDPSQGAGNIANDPGIAC